MTETTDPLREQALALLDGSDAHMPFEDAISDFPAWAINRRPPSVDYTPWHILEHIRITQWDILEYVRNPRHVSPPWPEGYWPAIDATATPDTFAATIAGFQADQAALRALVGNPSTDLLAAIPHTPGHTLLRELRLVGQHTAYHVGEFAILRQVMGTWPPGHR